MSRLPALGPRGEGWVIIQVVLFVAIAWAGTQGPAWDGDVRSATTVLGIVLVVGGGAMAVLGVRALGSSLTPMPYPRDEARLVETGIYGLVRHPIYGGIVVVGAGWGLATASLLALALAAVLLVFFTLKSQREEAWLASRFPGYEAYRARMKRLIPFLY